MPNLAAPSLDNPGLFRTQLAGRGATMLDTFAALRKIPTAFIQVPAHLSGKPLMGCRVPVYGAHGAGAASQTACQTGTWELIGISEHVFAVITNGTYTETRTEIVRPEGFVEFHFMLKGPVRVEFSNCGQIEIDAPKLTVVHQGANLSYQVSCGAGTWKSVALYLDRAYLERVLCACLGAENVLIRTLRAVASDELLCQQISVDRQAHAAVEQLLSNPFEGVRRLLFAQAKITEILCVSAGLWQGHLVGSQDTDTFSARDLRLVERAHDLLLSDLSQVPTITELARAVGTNTSKLKRGFKFLYGTTIFEYGHRHRMDHALHLLVEQRLPVNQVAMSVGYQHQTSFTASFREHFSFTPKDARRMASQDASPARSTAQNPKAPEQVLS